MRDTHAMYLRAAPIHIFQPCPSSKGNCRTTAGPWLCCRRPCWGLLTFSPQVTFSSSSRPAAVIPDAPPVCAHPFPLLSLAACWGLGSLQAWGVSLLPPPPLPHSLVHLLLGQSNEHIISLAPCQRELTRGPRGLLAQTGGLRGGGGYNHSRVFPSLSSLHPGSSISRVPVSLSA